MRAITALTTIAALTTLTGCDEINTVCTDHLAWSVELTLEDGDGGLIEDAQVSITDGTITEECYGYEGVYSCGAELAGDLTVIASAPGFSPDELDITVEADECHVITEQATLTLWPMDCTAEVVSSASVTVVDEDGAAIEEARVSYAPVSEYTDESIACEGHSGVYYCGEEIAGELDIFVDADGFDSHSERITVEMTPDNCHVITEQVDVVLIAE